MAQAQRTIGSTGVQAHAFEAFIEGRDACRICGQASRHHVRPTLDPTKAAVVLDHIWAADAALHHARMRLDGTAGVCDAALLEALAAVDTARKLVEAARKP